MRAVLVLLIALVATNVSGFQPLTRPALRQETSVYGLFDKFISDMEAGYKGEDSAFNKQKAFDEEKKKTKKEKFLERKAKGFTELKDVKGKTFAKTKYEYEEKPKEKKLWGIF